MIDTLSTCTYMSELRSAIKDVSGKVSPVTARKVIQKQNLIVTAHTCSKEIQ